MDTAVPWGEHVPTQTYLTTTSADQNQALKDEMTNEGCLFNFQFQSISDLYLSNHSVFTSTLVSVEHLLFAQAQSCVSLPDSSSAARAYLIPKSYSPFRLAVEHPNRFVYKLLLTQGQNLSLPFLVFQ